MGDISTGRSVILEPIATVAIATAISAALALGQTLALGAPLRLQALAVPCAVGVALGSLAAVRSLRLRTLLREAREQTNSLRRALAEHSGLEAAQSTLRAELAARDLLLRELHHRTKNNLQLVSALISRQIDEPDSGGPMVRLLGRVRTIALVHEQLHRQNDLERVNLRSFLDSVVTSVVRSLAPADMVVITDVEVDSVELEMHHAAPLGLIVNELTTNSIEHGFGGRTRGTIRLVCGVSDGLLRLHYSDDGVGMPEEGRARESVGLTLIEDLSRQLWGTLRMRTGVPGFALDLEMPQDRPDSGDEPAGVNAPSATVTAVFREEGAE